MNPTSTPSFIPKRNSPGGFAGRSPGLFSFVANLVFVIALIASVGVFAYQKYLEHEIGTMSDELTAAKAALEPNLINQLASSDARIIAGNDILNHHVTLSSFFTLLGANTVPDVRFTSFSYLKNTDGTLSISLKGQAKTYADVALESQIFSENPNFINPVFSNLDLDAKGNVVFTAKSGLAPNAVSYIAQFTNNASAPSNTTPASAVTSASSTGATSTPSTPH